VTGPAQELAGPWPFRPELLRPELGRYLTDAARPAIQDLPTCCPAWTVREVTIHLLCTFTRFHRLLSRGRAGDFSPPFPAEQLAAENQRAVNNYEGADPRAQLRAVVEAFGTALGDGDELLPHQLGPIPVALQVLFGVNELAIHHDDVALAAGHRYLPPPETLAVLQFMWQRRRPGRDITSWPDILQEAGRRL
jgi:uncharacterized protein (TIGR03083 family)